MSTVSTHVLDSALGRPAAGVPVRLEYLGSGGPAGAGAGGNGGPPAAGGNSGPAQVAAAVTDEDGRVGELGPGGLRPGTYRVVFDTAAYFARSGQRAFYPEVAISFLIEAAGGHYHVPLVLSPFAYATYRGS
jgi:5-hydroxyisourate hydrolase